MLGQIAELNPERLSILSTHDDGFRLRLSTAVSLDTDGEQPVELEVVFAPYYPAVPIEVYVTPAVRHPNVHPTNGFICLWDRHSPGDTVIEALRQTQRVLSGELRNAEADHLMQPEALGMAVIPYAPLRLPEGYLLEREARGFSGAKRKRLTEVE